MNKPAYLPASVLLLFVLATDSNASTSIAIKGGLGFSNGSALENADSPLPSVGGEVAFGLGGMIEVGGFFDRYILTGKGAYSNGGANFYGGIVRLTAPGTGIFLHGKMGPTKYANDTDETSSTLGYGFGVGSTIQIVKFFSISPIVGYTILPAKIVSGTLPFSNSTGDVQSGIFEFNLMFRFGF